MRFEDLDSWSARIAGAVDKDDNIFGLADGRRGECHEQLRNPFKSIVCE